MKNLTPEFLAAMRAPFKRVAFMVDLDWPGERVRLTTWSSNLTWDGHEWMGVGRLASLQLPSSGRATQARSATVGLADLPEQINGVIGTNIRNRFGAIYWALLDGSGQVIPNPQGVISGVMSARRSPIEKVQNGVRYSNFIDIWSGGSPRRPGSGRHSYEDQIAQYPGDTAGRHLSAIEGAVLLWPE